MELIRSVTISCSGRSLPASSFSWTLTLEEAALGMVARWCEASAQSSSPPSCAMNSLLRKASLIPSWASGFE
eukprot:15487967-Heterocapsa_arctica.AAC.1